MVLEDQEVLEDLGIQVDLGSQLDLEERTERLVHLQRKHNLSMTDDG